MNTKSSLMLLAWVGAALLGTGTFGFTSHARAQTVIHVEGNGAYKLRKALFREVRKHDRVVSSLAFTDTLGTGFARKVSDAPNKYVAKIVRAADSASARYAIVGYRKKGQGSFLAAIDAEKRAVVFQGWTKTPKEFQAAVAGIWAPQARPTLVATKAEKSPKIAKAQPTRRAVKPKPKAKEKKASLYSLYLSGLPERSAKPEPQEEVDEFSEVAPEPEPSQDDGVFRTYLAAAPTESVHRNGDESKEEKFREVKLNTKIASLRALYGMSNRSVSYDNIRSANLRPFEANNLGTFTLEIEGHPAAALLDDPWARILGLRLQFAQAGEARFNVGDDPDLQIPGNQSAFRVDAIGRLNLGPIQVTPSIGIGSLAFTFDRPAEGRIRNELPGASYDFIRFGGDVRAELIDKLYGTAGFGVMLLTGRGAIGDTFFPDASAFAFDAQVSLAYPVIELNGFRTDLVLQGDLTSVSYGIDVPNSATFRADGASDFYTRISFGVGVAL